MQITTDIQDTREVAIPLGAISLKGDLIIPERARGLVVFAHGRGSSRLNSSNRWLARRLRASMFGTLLFDLLTPQEELLDAQTSHLGFDIDLLATRLVDTTEWLSRAAQTRDLRMAYLGSSTGAAAVLVAAAKRPDLVQAVVCRGGRPDLADAALARVSTPSLIIAGSRDREVLDLHREAYESLSPHLDKKWVSLPEASHALDEAEALEEVSRATLSFLESRLSPGTEAFSLRA